MVRGIGAKHKSLLIAAGKAAIGLLVFGFVVATVVFGVFPSPAAEAGGDLEGKLACPFVSSQGVDEHRMILLHAVDTYDPRDYQNIERNQVTR